MSVRLKVFVVCVGLALNLSSSYAKDEAEPASVGPHRRFVNSLDDFHIHIEAHRLYRVPLLMRALLKAHPEAFPDVDLHTLREYEHDLAKETFYPRLYESFYARGRPSATEKERTLAKQISAWVRGNKRDAKLAEELVRQHAVNLQQELTDLGRQLYDLAETQTLIEELNALDHRVSTEFFRTHGMLDTDGRPNAIAKQYLLLEKVADGVDRSMDPVAAEEFGVARMKPAHQFMRHMDRHTVPLAVWLEAHYFTIVGSYDFNSVKELARKIRARLGRAETDDCVVALDKAAPPLLRWSRHSSVSAPLAR